MKKDRLLHLAEYLEKFPVSKEKFNMSYWMQSENFNIVKELPFNLKKDSFLGMAYFKGTINMVGKLVAPQKCKSAGCAMGWATTDPYFIKLGLCLVSIKYPQAINSSVLIGINNKKYITHLDSDAISYLFGINETQVQYLFLPQSYPNYVLKKKITPKIVAKRIREFLKNMT